MPQNMANRATAELTNSKIYSDNYYEYLHKLNVETLRSKIKNGNSIFEIFTFLSGFHKYDHDKLNLRDYECALHFAAAIGRLDVIQLFIKLGIRAQSNDNRALRLAAYYGHRDIVYYLADKGGAYPGYLTPDLRARYFPNIHYYECYECYEC